MDVKKGRKYRCIRTVYMNGDRKLDDLRYIEGKIYKSEIEGCITDETGEKSHIWTGWTEADKIFDKTFVLVHNKRRRHENIRNNKT
jgi:hypothetical protein